MIDLDANATTPLDPRVLDAMKPHFLAGGNPESRHSLGRLARKAWNDAREISASILGAHPDELTFTSGGTEANNTAIFGLINRLQHPTDSEPNTVLLSTIEHPAIAEPLAHLHKIGKLKTIHLPVQNNGITSLSCWLEQLKKDRKPILATCMLANNETGAIQPIDEIASAAADLGIAFHTDAVQAVGRIDVNFHNLGVTSLAAGSHKMHGPPGIGILLIKSGTRIEPVMHGGGQQRKLRPGTPPVALAVGLSKALELWDQEKSDRILQWSRLKSQFLNHLLAELANTSINFHMNSPETPDLCLPQTLNLWFDHPLFVGEVALIQLDLAGLAVSLGSACASGSNQPSPILKAMGFHDTRAKSSIRISFSAMTSEQDVFESAKILAKTALNLINSHESSDMEILIGKARRRFSSQPHSQNQDQSDNSP